MKNEQALRITSVTTILRQEMMDKMLSRQDLFVNNSNVCLLTSIEKQSGAKIAAVIRKIKELSKDTLEYDGPILQFSDMKSQPYSPEIDLYIKCDDEQLSDKSEKILSALRDEFLAKGFHIKLHALNGAADKFAVAVKKMITDFQIAQIKTNSNQSVK